jgi:hypothetical protein
MVSILLLGIMSAEEEVLGTSHAGISTRKRWINSVNKMVIELSSLHYGTELPILKEKIQIFRLLAPAHM